MPEAADPSNNAAIQIIRALFQGVGDGRLDDVLGLVHTDVVWLPMTRPGRSRYVGHGGTREIVEDLGRTLGKFHVEFNEFVETPDGRIVARGVIVRAAP